MPLLSLYSNNVIQNHVAIGDISTVEGADNVLQRERERKREREREKEIEVQIESEV